MEEKHNNNRRKTRQLIYRNPSKEILRGKKFYIKRTTSNQHRSGSDDNHADVLRSTKRSSHLERRNSCSKRKLEKSKSNTQTLNNMITIDRNNTKERKQQQFRQMCGHENDFRNNFSRTESEASLDLSSLTGTSHSKKYQESSVRYNSKSERFHTSFKDDIYQLGSSLSNFYIPEKKRDPVRGIKRSVGDDISLFLTSSTRYNNNKRSGKLFGSKREITRSITEKSLLRRKSISETTAKLILPVTTNRRLNRSISQDSIFKRLSTVREKANMVRDNKAAQHHDDHNLKEPPSTAPPSTAPPSTARRRRTMDNGAILNCGGNNSNSTITTTSAKLVLPIRRLHRSKSEESILKDMSAVVKRKEGTALALSESLAKVRLEHSLKKVGSTVARRHSINTGLMAFYKEPTHQLKYFPTRN